jgi:predicted dehydrogenase
MNFPLRWHKPFVDAQHAILRGDIGQIKAIQAEYRYGRIHKITEGWRGKIADYSFVMGGGIHLLDVMQWIGEPVIYGNTSRAIKDVSATSGGLERGGVFTLTCDFATPGPHARRMRIAGSKDDIFIDDQDPTDKERPLTEFLRCLKLRPENGDNYSREFVDAIEDLPSPSQIFRVHEIGLSL